MRIGIDARFYGPSETGLGRYVSKLLENLEKLDNKNDYIIFLLPKYFSDFRPKNPRFKKVVANASWYSLKEQVLMPYLLLKENLDLVHFPHFNIPIFYPKRFVVTIHDLIKDEFFQKSSTTRFLPIYFLKHQAYKLIIRVAIKRSQKIITPTNFVKKKIIKRFGVDSQKIVVTAESGVISRKQKRSEEERKKADVLGKYGIFRPFLLYVGNVYPYKNLGRLLEAIKIVKAQLVIVGARDAFKKRLEEEIRKKGVLRYVTLCGYVPDIDLIDLYREAEAFVLPSLSEGFGITAVEAISLGCPVLVSNTSCLPEVLGTAALYFDPLDVSDIAEKIKKLAGNKVLREELIKKGLRRAKKFSWEKMAKQTLEVYNSLIYSNFPRIERMGKIHG